MNQHLAITPISLNLARYPMAEKDQLKAWNAADELLIKQAFDLPYSPDSLLILNDDFGAIACAISAHPKFADTRIYWQSDSVIAQRALQQNLATNHLAFQRVTVLSSLDTAPTASTVLMRLPKSLNYLEFQLIQLQATLSDEQILIAGGMIKHIAKTMFNLIEKHIGQVSTSLAEKKARLLFGQTQAKQSPQPYPLNWALNEYDWQLNDHANVFCLGKFDIGSRFMLENMPEGDYQQVIDLGCGNGLLGLAASQRYPNAKIDFIDESLMAIASAKENLMKNQAHAVTRCRFIADNCLEQQASAYADLILCNPPFHQQNTVSIHIAKQMFSDAKRCLAPGGKLVIVANRHLPYPALLKQLFGAYKVSASNNKFVILESTKR